MILRGALALVIGLIGSLSNVGMAEAQVGEQYELFGKSQLFTSFGLAESSRGQVGEKTEVRLAPDGHSGHIQIVATLDAKDWMTGIVLRIDGIWLSSNEEAESFGRDIVKLFVLDATCQKGNPRITDIVESIGGYVSKHATKVPIEGKFTEPGESPKSSEVLSVFKGVRQEFTLSTPPCTNEFKWVKDGDAAYLVIAITLGEMFDPAPGNVEKPKGGDWVEPIPRSWLEDEISVEDAEKAEMVTHDQLGPKPVPFGFQNGEWVKLKGLMKDGSVIRKFCSPPDTWKHLAGRSGYCLVTGGKIIKCITVMLN